ncbi:AMP-binding protein [Catenulispora subtropica]|uniref:Carrier domain-containing protein n=1 Tax=Catenulispora subtropica TaxID=450798 RepID=A0ABP5DRR3_9ACTN
MRSFGASSAHKGIWLAQAMAPDMLNHALTMWDVEGALDPAIMESCFRHVLTEAEVLRVNFVDDGGGLRLVPWDLVDWQPFFLDLSNEPDPEQAARDALAEMLKQPFDLELDLLLRLGLVKLAADRSLVVIAYHHLVSDGHGAGGLLSRRLAEVYTAMARGTQVPDLPQPWDAESFAAEAVRYRASEQFAEDTDFWRDYLADAPAPAQVPRVALSEAARAALDEPTGSQDRWGRLSECLGMVSRTLPIPRDEADVWAETAKSLDVWMSSLVTAAAAVYLRHRCDRPELLMSLAVGNRVGPAGKSPGLAVNVAPIRVRVPLGATFAEVADTVVDQTYEIFGHTACHYSEIQRAGGTTLTGRGSFGAVINVGEFMEHLHFGGHPARYLGATTGVFDELSLGVYTDGSPDSDLYLRLDAPATLYSSAELRFIGEDLLAYIRALVADPQRPVGAVSAASGAAAAAAPADGDTTTVTERFARRVRETPDAVAVVADGFEVSYRELDERSNLVAEVLRRRGIGEVARPDLDEPPTIGPKVPRSRGTSMERVVVVALPRSVDMVVALLGVVKAGAAYLATDPAALSTAAPAASPVSLLLSDAATIEGLGADPGVPTLALDAVASDTPGSAAPAPPHRAGLLAEVAASTGAVAVTHRSLGRFGTDRHTVLWHSPSTFDALALEVWTPLLNGGRIVVAPPGRLDASALAGAVAAHEISAVFLPAGLFSAIAADLPEALAGLREVWTGGDRVSVAARRRVREACPELTIVTGHGSVETAGFAVCDRLAPGEPVRDSGALGRPMEDTALYVLGPGLTPVPPGVAGELYVAGPGLARGYIGRPRQTAEKFVPCPFGPPGAVMFRTGDRVRWNTDGGLDHLGRADARAQIRDARVESAEIEEVLSGHPDVAQAVVAVKDDGSGQQRLAAYVVPASGREVAEEELRRFAAGRLPEFMVPSVFMVLERLSTAPDGRVDRAALPAPGFDDGRYRAPRNRTERVLAEAFADVLEVSRVGIDDDFFDLGGNSVRAIKLVGLIRAELNQEVSIRTLFAARTVIGLSDQWDELAASNRPALRRRTQDGEVL